MPASPDTLADLLLEEDQATIYADGLELATTLNLPVTSWQPGDPTRAQFQLEAEMLFRLQQVVTGFIGSGFLDFAKGVWLQKVIAKQVFNVDVPDATYAETDVTLTNSLGGVYDLDPGDVVFKNSTSGKTYTSTSGGHLAGSGGTLIVHVIADETGSASSSAAGEIDALVTTLTGVTCTNAAAAVGLDVQDPSITIQQCRDKSASLSPNGPAAAYTFVSLNSALTGIKTITRARVYPDSDTGDVLLYVAGPSGSVSGGDVTAVQDAITLWATPLCITPTVTSAAGVTIAVTYTLWLYKSVNQTTSQIQDAVQAALEALFVVLPIGGDIIPPATTGLLYQSIIESVIGAVFPKKTFRVVLSLPASDTSLANGEVPQLGTVTGTINLVADP